MKYHYFISFSFVTGERYRFGNTSLYIDSEIIGMEPINRLAAELEQKHGFTGVIILNFILLNKIVEEK